MLIILTIIHVLVCLFLTIVVLLQSGKAADLAGAFGGMGSQTAFGPRGSATLLSKATTLSAIVFMCTSLALSIVETRNAGTNATILEKKTPAKQSVPGANPPAQGPAPMTATPSIPGAPKGQPQPLRLPPKK
ncbi:MAG: preprotein translocase subunit SecG [Acidobacteriia bacterium]|nr:preprotein translocase subunit SecG [Terriglobia bacterium]